MIASDTPGGRPDLERARDPGRQGGRPRQHDDLYLVCRTGYFERFSAQTRLGDKSQVNWSRDTVMLGRWLEQFSGAAGGALFTVTVGNAEQALARISTELKSYYLLGVEPGDEDRDGRTHEITVKTTQPNVSIRGRRWVMVPKRTGAGSATTATAAPTPTRRRTRRLPLPPARPRLRRDRRAARSPGPGGRLRSRQLRRAATAQCRARPSLANTIRAFRMSDSPWPNDPKANGGVRAGDGARRTAQRQHASRARKAAGCWPNTTRASAQPSGAGCVRVLVVPDRSGSARRTLPARQRHALHPASAAALPHQPAAAPGLCVRVRTAVDARRTDAGTGTRGRAAVRRGDEVSRDRARGARARGAVSLRPRQRSTARSTCSTAQHAPSTDKEVRYFTQSGSRPGPARPRPFRRGGGGVSRGARDLAGRAVRARRADDAARQSRRTRGSGARSPKPPRQLRERVRSLVDVLAGRLPRRIRRCSTSCASSDDDARCRCVAGLVAIGGRACRRLARRQPGRAPAQDPAPVFRAGADVVSVEAAVRRERRPVTGLTRRGFRAPRQRRRAGDHRHQLREAADRRHGAPRRQRQRDGSGARRVAPRAAAAADRPRRPGSTAAHHLRHARPAARRFQRSRAGGRQGAGVDRRRRQQRRSSTASPSALTTAVRPGAGS